MCRKLKRGFLDGWMIDVAIWCLSMWTYVGSHRLDINSHFNKWILYISPCIFPNLYPSTRSPRVSPIYSIHHPLTTTQSPPHLPNSNPSSRPIFALLSHPILLPTNTQAPNPHHPPTSRPPLIHHHFHTPSPNIQEVSQYRPLLSLEWRAEKLFSSDFLFCALTSPTPSLSPLLPASTLLAPQLLPSPILPLSITLSLLQRPPLLSRPRPYTHLLFSLPPVYIYPRDQQRGYLPRGG